MHRFCGVAATFIPIEGLVTIYSGPVTEPEPSVQNCVMGLPYKSGSSRRGFYKQLLPTDFKSEGPFIASSTSAVCALSLTIIVNGGCFDFDVGYMRSKLLTVKLSGSL